MASNALTLDVSGRKFRTTKAVLSTSPYFESLFARWEDCADLQPDGSYYIDADPDVFEHLLNFMRRPSRFPLYWTKKDGFNYVLYSKLEAEADYFMLEGLKNWIKDRKYLEAITIKQRVIDRYDLGIHRSGDCEIKHFIIKGALEAPCPSGFHPSWGQDCWRNECDNRKGPKQQLHIQAKDVFLTVTTEFVFVNDILQNEGT